MAAKNNTAPRLKKAAGKEKAAVKPQAAAKPKGGKPVQQGIETSLVIEIISIIALVFSFLLILSIYTDNGAGAFGQAVAGVTKGLFGVGAYLIPIIIIFISVYILLTENKYFSGLQIALGFIIFTVIISLFHILTSSAIPTYENAAELISSNYKNGNFSNGGLFGAIFALFFLSLLGKLGASVLLSAIGIVSVILLTRYSLVGFLKTVSSDMKNRPKRIRAAAPEKTITVDSIKHKRVEVYDAPPVFKKQKVFNHVVEDVERSSDEREIHIITGGKKITRETFRSAVKKKEKEKEPLIESQPPETKAEPLPEKIPAPEKPVMEEYFVGSPRLNFDIIEDDDEPEEFEPETPELPKLTFDIVSDDEEEDWEDIDEETSAASVLINTNIKAPDIKAPEPSHMPTIIEAAPVKLASAPESRAQAEYIFPSIEMLKKNPGSVGSASKAQILENSKKLEDTLRSFGVEAKVIEVSMGPAVTRYELSPGQGVKVSRISGLADDLALNLAAAGIRIEAPIPGKAAVGIEVPNKEIQAVYLREVIEVEEFAKFPSNLAFALGKDIAGNTIVADIAKMPHLLIAGATGSGKSVCINTLITSILYKSSPEDVKLLMVDPKVVELSVYNGIPHLMIPVVTDPKKAAGALNWAVREMISRYNSFAETSVRDLKGYNRWLEENGQKPLPQIVIIVDELSDLMMVAQNEVEDAICRLAQMARAAGLHLVIATQRPSVDVITGLIKANIPSRIAFSVSSGTDSRTILDMTGAEKLLGKGDMLFYPSGMNKPLRVQGAFISDKEVETIVSFLKENNAGTYDDEMIEKITSSGKSSDGGEEGSDDLFTEAVDFIVQKDRASVSMLQRRFRIGYNRAARLMEDLEERGFVDAGDGAKPRKVAITSLEWSEYKERNGL